MSVHTSIPVGHLRGTAFGILYSVLGVVAVLNNGLIGNLWHSFGANAAFGASAGLTAGTLLLLPWLLPPGHSNQLSIRHKSVTS